MLTLARDVGWTLVTAVTGVHRPGVSVGYTTGSAPKPLSRRWWKYRVAAVKAVPSFVRADWDMHRVHHSADIHEVRAKRS